MRILLNGIPREVAPGSSVADLIAELGLVRDQVAVEHNRVLVKRAEHGNTTLAEGDTLEVVSLVGGG